jgi:dipeptidyl aminopeptidase/acylaminoacyl peptidase
VGFAIDVLNLIAIVHQMAGHPGVFEKADGDNVFLWGHSMGGGIIQRVLAVGADVNGAVLYASMSGNERRNFEHIRDVLSDGLRGLEELAVPDEILVKISPAGYYDRIEVPISIHHGDIDDIVPLEWSQELCITLADLAKDVECFYYHNMPHTFFGTNDELFLQRTLEFFERNKR